jgi:uncharacterized protein YndB with AHSA1/START domain
MQIDPIAAIGTVVREVQSREHEGKPARVVVACRDYDTTAEDLWDALTSPERIPRWFLPVTGDLKPGGRYQLQGNASGEITACIPPRKLALTWEFGGQVTWVNVTLTAQDDGVRLELEHIAPVDEKWGQFGPGAVGIGWDLSLQGLALHVDSGGAPVDPAEFAAWSASNAGKTFIRASSEDWCRADIADGAEPAAARASAARTAAFYCGEA